MSFWLQFVGVALLTIALILSLTNRSVAGDHKVWRGDPISYGNPYGPGSGWLARIRQRLGRR